MSMDRSADRLAIVTGGGRGIGRASAIRIAEDGFSVVVIDIDAEGAERTAREIRAQGGIAEARALDLVDRARVFAEFEQIAQQHGRIDAVVNAAMRVDYRPIEEFDEAGVDALLAIGLKAVLWTTQAVIPPMRRQGGGSIVMFSSPAATRGVHGSSIYSASKGAISSLTWQLAGELGSYGIRVNGVVPGAVPTEGARAVVDDAGYETRRKANALGRLGTPEDIANGVAFLLSPGASYVNGHLLAIDGKLL